MSSRLYKSQGGRCALVFPKQFSAGAKPDLKWNEIPEHAQKVKEADLPWPIVLAVQRFNQEDPNRKLNQNDPIWEFTLTEFGTWKWGYDKKVRGAFTPIKYLGTEMSEGRPKDAQKCWQGFDNAG